MTVMCSRYRNIEWRWPCQMGDDGGRIECLSPLLPYSNFLSLSKSEIGMDLDGGGILMNVFGLV